MNKYYTLKTTGEKTADVEEEDYVLNTNDKIKITDKGKNYLRGVIKWMIK